MSRRDNRARRRAYQQASLLGYPRLAVATDRQAEAERIRCDPASTEAYLRRAAAGDGGVWAAARSLVAAATGIDPQHVSDSVAAAILGGEMIAEIAAPRLAACRGQGIREQTAGHRTRRCRGM